MKKIIVAILIAVTALTFTACGENTNSNNDNSDIEWLSNPANPASPINMMMNTTMRTCTMGGF